MVSTRIDDDLKEQIDAFDINTSEVVREALAAEVRQRRRERIKERGERLVGVLDDAGITSEEITQAIREDRDAPPEER